MPGKEAGGLETGQVGSGTPLFWDSSSWLCHHHYQHLLNAYCVQMTVFGFGYRIQCFCYLMNECSRMSLACIHSLNKNVLWTYYVPGIALDAVNTAETQRDKIAALVELTF